VATRKSSSTTSGEVTSAGVPWSDASDSDLVHAEWMDGRHGSAKQPLASIGIHNHRSGTLND
jgi:hypothetical protein